MNRIEDDIKESDDMKGGIVLFFVSFIGLILGVKNVLDGELFKAFYLIFVLLTMVSASEKILNSLYLRDKRKEREKWRYDYADSNRHRNTGI